MKVTIGSVVRLCAVVLGVAVAASSCNLFNDLGDAWTNAEATSAGAGGNMCAGMGGAGGDGGDGGAGGGDEGAGGDGSGAGAGPGVSVGAGGSSAESAGAGAGDGDGAWSNGGVGHVARAPRHRGHRGGIGRAGQADCPTMMPPMQPAPATPAWTYPPVPNVIPLTTMRLRAIATAQGIGVGQTGITLNRTMGLAFENWVLTMLGQIPRNTMSFLSPERQSHNSANGGLPASVIPEYVSDLALFFFGGMAPSVLPDSEFWEVKAVTGTLTPASNRYQIVGLIDVASRSPAGMSTAAKHPPPTVVFTITGNTSFSPSVYMTATASGVAIWLQTVFVDATIPNDPNPDLYIGAMYPMNPDVYITGVPVPSPPSGAHSKLTSPPTPPVPVPGDPDPPEVD
jgi:hypothetical protein